MRFGPNRLLALLLPVAGLCLLPAGCATTSTTEEAAIGVPPQSPTNPAEVAILHSEPTRPHIKLGKVTVDGSTEPAPPVEKIEADLKKGAAKLGGDAVVLVVDRTQTMGAVVTGGDWGRWGVGDPRRSAPSRTVSSSEWRSSTSRPVAVLEARVSGTRQGLPVRYLLRYVR